jgi:hypothetical protein
MPWVIISGRHGLCHGRPRGSRGTAVRGVCRGYTHAIDGGSALSVLPSLGLLTVVKVLPAQQAFTARINAGRGTPARATQCLSSGGEHG